MMTDILAEPAIEQHAYPQPTPPEAPSIERSGIDEPQLPTRTEQERVVILHGIGRTSMSMAKVARAFRQAGYKEDNLGYNSTRDVLRSIIDDVYNRIRRYSDDAHTKVHFVCYSLGCLVTRGVIEQHRPANLGRVVMMGPPNQGSELADYLKDHAVSNWLFGPNLPQLGTANRDMLLQLIGDNANYELGIIAGQNAIDPIGAAILADPNDGRVPVERTMLEGMKEHLVVDANHTTLITNDAVIAQALHFIQNGHFDHEPPRF
jgi:pimeloyl-ACP methyl ester carboxylesterase